MEHENDQSRRGQKTRTSKENGVGIRFETFAFNSLGKGNQQFFFFKPLEK